VYYSLPGLLFTRAKVISLPVFLLHCVQYNATLRSVQRNRQEMNAIKRSRTLPLRPPFDDDDPLGSQVENERAATAQVEILGVHDEDTPTTLLTRTQYEINNERIALRLTSISGSDIDYVYSVLRQPSDDLLIEKFGCNIFWNKIKCFRNKKCYPNQRNKLFWLNDEVINFYMGLLQDLDKQLCKDDNRRLPSYFFNLFFMSKLLEGNKYNFNNVMRC
jgi:hypothetical protein